MVNAGKKILVIEDDKTVRENIVSLLTEEDYNVNASGSGDEGIMLAKKILPDLIICDIMMKGTDGYQVLKQLSFDHSTRSIPFIFLTAKVEKEDIRLGMNLGADDYLFKPFDAEELLKAISSRLKRVETLKADYEPDEESEAAKKYSMDDKLFIQVNKIPVLINIADIVFISADRQYCTLKINDGKSYLLRKSISHWEKILPEKKFLRIHRSTIININYLVKIEPWFNASYMIYLKNTEKPFMISRRYSVQLRGKLFK